MRVVEGELDVVARVSSDGQRAKGLDGQSGVGVRTRLDERGGDRVDLVETEGSVVRTLPWLLLEHRGRLPRLVSRLDRQDRASDGEVGLVGDVLGGAEVGGRSDVLDQVSEGDERVDVGVWAVVSGFDTNGEAPRGTYNL